MNKSTRYVITLVCCSTGGLVGILGASRNNFVETGRQPSMSFVALMLLVVALAAQGWAVVISKNSED